MAEVKNQYKVLRLYDGGAEPADDWHKISDPYGPNDIEKIKDPAGATDRNEITSIPSPFARIHLFETAFRIVTDKATDDINELDGNTIYHKLVSDSLDVAEMFFKYDFFKSKYNLGITKWDKASSINELKGSTNEQHQLLGETLDLYLRQDGDLSNFGKTQNLYFITLNHRIVGGTSPSTLFFSSGNDLSFAQLVQGNDTFFDDEYNPLYNRDISFQKYLLALFKVHPSLTNDMGLVWRYMEINMKALEKKKPTDYQELKGFKEAQGYRMQHFREEFKAWDSTETIQIFPDPQEKMIEHCKKSLIIGERTVGDFIIRSEKYKGKKPVVLQNKYGRQLNYFGGKWNPETAVPYLDEAKLDERFVPGQDVQYPYLTVSDFLEPYLIEVPYAIDNESFFIGNPDGFFRGDTVTKEPADNLYLLPIKSFFFKFFDIKDLSGFASQGRPILRMVKVGLDAVRVELLIPIKAEGEYIKFERVYKPGGTPDEKKNDGAIVKCKFSMGFLPFNENDTGEEQRVGFLDADVSFGNSVSDYRLAFMDVADSGCRPVEAKNSTIRSDESKGHGHNVTSKYFVIEKPYHLIEVTKSNGVKGLLLPKFQNRPKGNSRFTFAIDFGTTNTHVEYSVDGENPIPFDIENKKPQLITLFDRSWGLADPQLRSHLERELIPFAIGEGNKHRFPMRTATSEIKGLDHIGSTFALGDINIPFHYEKEESLKSEKIETNLKWTKFKGSDGKINANRVDKFIETLLVLIRNKVLLNGGDLNRTDIIWFYPSSMSANHINQFRRIWHASYKSYINPKGEPIDYSESEVPFYKHPPSLVKSRQYPVVSIDIGGGTTDVVLFLNDKPAFLTSFKFAGNTVFGDGYREDVSAENGFVQFFKHSVEEFLDHNKNELHSLNGVYDQLSKPGACSSSDLMAFFFSIENNQDLENKNLQFKFSEEVANHEEFNIVFLVFYGAIIYHIASLMRKLKFDMPRNICLSGNGSKIINLLDPDPKLDGIAQLSKLMFEKVYTDMSEGGPKKEEGDGAGGDSSKKEKVPYHKEGLQVVQGDKPKEVTCKGGIIKFEKEGASQKAAKAKFDRVVLLGDKTQRLINNQPIEFPSEHLKYQDITTEHKKSSLREIEKFVDTLFALNDDFNFEDNFGIATSALREYKTELLRDMQDSLARGLAKRLELSDKDKNVEESLFFYPLVASLYHLTQVIAEKN